MDILENSGEVGASAKAIRRERLIPQVFKEQQEARVARRTEEGRHGGVPEGYSGAQAMWHLVGYCKDFGFYSK